MIEATASTKSRSARTVRGNADTVTARAREWILAREPYEVFWLREVPGDPRITSALMSRLVREENSGVTRLRRGFYMKGEWLPLKSNNGGRDGFWYMYPRSAKQRVYTVARYLGDSYAGFGLAGYDAMSVFHWTNQCPIRTTLSVARHNLPLTPLQDQVILRQRSNERRLQLSVAENTIIEAVRFSYMRENSLKERLAVFKRPAFALQRMALYVPKRMIVVRPEMLVWGAEAEYGQPARVKEIVSSVADIINEDIIYTDIAKW